MAGIARPFIPWIGSKEKLIPHLWQVFPPNPKLYLEPFGGGGALLLGILETLLLAALGSGYSTIAVFAVMLVFLLIRPQGIAGSNVQEKA